MNEELRVIISAEVGRLQQGMQQAHDAVQGFTERSGRSLEGFQNGINRANEVVKKGAKAVAKGVAAVTTALLAAAPATKDFREAQAKLATAFEAAGGSAEEAKDTYNDLYRVLGDDGQATEAAAHLAKLTTNQKELSEWTTICEGVYATFGESLPIEGLTEAANETAKTGQLTGVLADALNWAGIAEDDFQAKLDACNSEAEREQTIRETLNGTYSEAASLYEKNAAAILAQNEANAAMQEAMAKVGEAMAPVNAALTQLGADILNQLAPYIQQFADNYLPGICEALSGVGEAVGKVINFIAEHWDLLVTIGAIIAAVAAAIAVVNAALTVYTAVMAVVNIVTMPITGIIMLVVAAIAALIAIIVVCVTHWEEITAACSKAWESIKEATHNAVEKVKEFFTNMWNNIKETVSNMVNGVKEKFNAIKDAMSEKVAAAKEAVVNKFTEIKSGIQEKVEAAKSVVSSTFDNIKSAISSKLSAAKSSALSIFDGIKSGIKAKIDAARDGVQSAIEKIKGFFNFSWSLPHIKLPHFSIDGQFSLNPPSIPHFGVSWYANGGVFDKPTLFNYGNGSIGGLGEAGAEAVVPLEKNTKWLDRMASMLASKTGGNTPIILQVDGKTFGEIAVDSINDLTRMNGSLPLRLI